MRKQINRITTIWAIREIVHLLLALGAVGMFFWFLHQLQGMGW